LNELLQKYQTPLLTHLRWRFGAAAEQAEDWFQSFVEKKVLEKHLLASARRERGRFRTFLLNALDNFVADELRREHRALRRPPGGFVPGDGRVEGLPAVPATLADPSDVAWARAVLAQAMTRLREYYAAKGRPELWQVFHEGFARPILDEVEPPGMAELAQRFGFPSARHASNRLLTAKQQFKRCMELVVGEYMEGAQAIEAELRDLMAILAGSG